MIQIVRRIAIFIFLGILLPASLFAAPSITGLSPTSGAVGASVTITGTSFGSTQGTSTVKFNGTTATAITSWSATSIVATVPTGATTGNVVVTVSGGASNGVSFTVVGAPSITSLSLTSGAVGASVTITGTNFGSTQGTSTVKFNGTTATVSTWSATSVKVTVPTGATTGNVVVHASGVDSNGVSFTVVSAPSITSLSPTSGAVGASVTITGTNFGSTQGSSTVKFNTTTATTITSWSATSIVATVPTGATTGSVVVNASGVNSNGVSFTVVSAPSITSLSVTSGAVGTAVTITGTNFGSTQGTSTVKFNGTTATVSTWSATSVKVTVPTGATTGNVVVHASGVDSNGVAFTVFPSISSLSPTSGAVGASVTVTGVNFGSTQGTSTVKFNGTTATTISNWSATSIVATVPTGATTGNVVVTVGGNASNGISFTVVAAPSVTSLSPTTGAVGASVTIAGSNFGSTQGTSTVKFNGTTATSITSWSATSIVATVPTGATTGNVVVNASGVNSNGISFTVVAAPSITSLSPTTGAVGASVTIAGSAFGSTQGTSTVKFNGTTATSITSWSATSIVAIVPTGATTGNVVVNASGVNSNGVSFTVVAAPSITSLSPTTGAVGASVTIAGSGFGSTQGTSTVKFNGTTATTISSWSATSIVATVPTGATTGNVVVNASGVNSNGVSFTVVAAPSITSLLPTSGAVGASVTITGTNFGATQGSGSVSFNGTTAVSITNWSAASIVAIVPTGATTGNVVVNASGVNSNGVSFTVVAAPSITSLSPTTGAVGASVTIAGSGFGSTQGTSTLKFNGTTATSITSWSATSIVATVPTGATTGNVVVNGSGVNSNGVSFTVLAAPSITSLSPTSGAVSASVTITGTNFGATQGSGSVSFNGTTAASITSWSAASIVAIVPTGATTGNVVVNASGVNSNGVSFTVVAAPSITSLSPTTGAVGASVTISGTNFGATQGSGSVSFNGTTATSITNWSATSIVAIVPTGATTGNVVVNASGVNSNGVSFTVVAAPSITSLSPTTGAVGASVTLAGSSFGSTQGTSTVKFNGTTATSITSWSATSIVATVPTGATTGNVVVNASGVNSNGIGFTVVAAPSITSLSPTSGAVGASVTIAGANFGATQGSGSVSFNGSTATSITSWSATSIVVIVPTGATTGNVVVNASGVNSNGMSFTVVTAPGITSLSPTSGAVGASVTITGTNFGSTQGASTVTFNGTTATTITSWSATSIVAAVPTAATMGNVVVTVSGLASNGVSFTVLPTPTISSVSPTSGTDGISVTITGTNFAASQGSSTVTFNGTPATSISSWSATSISAVIPAGATTGNVVVTVSGVASNGVLVTITTSSLPAVTQVQPANGATSVPINGRVIVRFAQAVQASAIVPGTLTVSQGATSISGNVTQSNDGLSLTFAPTQNLSASTTYSVAVTNVAGGQNSPQFQSTFTTGTSSDTVYPLMVQSSPQSNATGVPISAPVQVQFTKPIDPATLTPQSFNVTDNTAGTTIAGMIQVDPSGITASFVPQSLLPVGRTISVDLTGAVQDSSGNGLQGSAYFSFTTAFAPDTTAPRVLGSSPANGASNVPVNAVIVLQFSKPLDAISVPNGLQVQSGGQAVPGAIALSNSNQMITFTPTAGLTANTSYTVTAGSQITDVGGLALSNPSTYSFTTGTANDTTTPTVTSESPSSYETNVPTNPALQVQFSKAVDPWTVTGTTFYVYPTNTNDIVPATVTVSSNSQSATLTPTAPLIPFTMYYAQVTSGISDLEGHALNGQGWFFTTGATTDSTAPAVQIVSPANGDSSVPVNVRVDVRVSTQLSPMSVSNSSVVLAAGGTNVPGNVTLSSDGLTLTYIPTSNLATSTAHTVTVSGVSDQAGNMITTFTSTFTTSASGAANTTQPTVLSISPSNGSSGVSVNSSIIITFNEPIDPTTISTATVPVLVSGFSGVLAGNYTFDSTGTVLTFTPLSPLPQNATIVVQVYSSAILDLSGNPSNYAYSTFSTGAGSDATGPSVVSVTPQNGATGMGANVAIVLTFSESLNPNTINTGTLGLLVNGSAPSGGVGITTSQDNRVVTLSSYSLAPSSVVTVLATPGLTDLYGNPLTNFQSEFYTGPALSATAPAVVSQRPGVGATGVPANSSVVLYFSQPMNVSTLLGGVFVSQNGTLASGTLQVSDNGQTVQFIPTAAFPVGALVQVFVASTVQSTAGAAMNSYQSSFTVAPNTSATAPFMISSNPANSASGVPTNIAMDIGFNVPIDPNSITPTTVLCYQNNVWFQNEISLVNGGTVLQIVPRLPLPANTFASCQVSTSLLGLNGVPSQGASLQLTTGSGPDTVVPTVSSFSPPNGSVNVGDNANIHFTFSKPINPLTVNASTIQLSGGGSTFIPDSISFSNSNQTVLLVPHAPMPDNTLMTLTISGVTDVAGNPVANQTTTFTTGTGPDVIPPTILWTNPQTGLYTQALNVPLNAIVQIESNEPIDPASVNTSSWMVLDTTNGQNVPGTSSTSADGVAVTFVPNPPLAPNRQYHVYFQGRGMTDLAGNPVGVSGLGDFVFTTGTSASTSAPQVTQVSPASGATGIPINAQAVIGFNEPVDAAKLSGVSLTGPSGTVTTSLSVFNGNQSVALIPTVPLATGMQYTIHVAGVQDFSGNLLASPVTSSFSTGTAADLNPPRVTSSTPSANSTGISTTAAIQVQFSKAIDPVSITPTTFQVYPYNTSIPVAGTVSTTAHGQTVTFTPTQALDSLTFYYVSLTTGITDMEGQPLTGSASFFFTTAQGTTSLAPVIGLVNPSSTGTVGTSISIDGTYFGTSQGSGTVTFNGTTATATNWTDSQISVTVPTGATTGPLVVTVNGVASNSWSFTVPYTPTITNVSPTTVAVGSVLTLTGTNFGDAQDSVSVFFSSNIYPTPLTPTLTRSETSITVTVPPTAVTGAVYILSSGNQSAGASLTVLPVPTISQLSPNSGIAGTAVAIYGTNFGASQGSSTLTFNGAPATITSWSNGYIAAIPPSNVTTGPVTMVVNTVPSTNNPTFVVTNPAIGTLSPPSGSTGSTITITGSGLATTGLTTQVFFNGLAGTVISATSGTVTAFVPQNATSGPVSVLVGTLSSNTMQFTVEQPPAISLVSPNEGPFGPSGTTAPITITGSGFGATQSNSTVNFYLSTTAPQIQSWSDTAISVWVPNDAGTGPLTVTVGNVTATAPSWFYVNRQTVLTDSLGNQTSYSFQSQGGYWFTAQSVGPGCVTCSVRGNITNTGDSNGNILTSTDDLSNTTTYTYDSLNDMMSASKPLNVNTTATTSYTYNSFGEVLTMTDPLGNTTTNTYDAQGNLLTVTTPQPNGNTSASVTQFQYATNGELTQITDPLSHVTKLTYTSAGLIASITDAQNNVTSYQYDTRGNRIAVIDPINGASHPTSFAYDIMNRLTGITYPNGSTVSFTYDVRGRRITSTDQNNKTTTYTYDDADRLTTVTDPAHNTTQYAYDTEDNLLSITDANNHSTQFAYNNRGWVTQTTFPSTLQESYTYDLVGNLLSKTDRKSQTIQYVYDALYRLSSKTYPDSSGVEYAYDLAGKVQQVSDPTGTYGFAYDNMGRLIGTTTQYSYLPGLNFQNAYTYDAASNRTSLTAPDGSISTYGYDTMNRLNGLANSWAGSFGFGYDALSRRTSLTRPNGVNTSYSYDSVSHLLSVLHQAGVNDAGWRELHL